MPEKREGGGGEGNRFAFLHEAKKGSPPSSRRRRHSSVPHFMGSIPVLPKEKTALQRSFLLVTVVNNDTVSYGCIRVALELQTSVRKIQPS